MVHESRFHFHVGDDGGTERFGHNISSVELRRIRYIM
jgi:hypothetical protein